ncbi:universal stress protein [Cellulomonas hominis]
MDTSVVVGYDTSHESAVAVEWAAGEAVRRRCRLDVVHVWGFAGSSGGGAGTSWLGERVIAGVQEIADEGAALARTAQPSVEAQGVVAHGSPAQALVDGSRHAAVVVLGRRGVGRFPGALLGSVTSGVLSQAACPVAVVPEAGPPEREHRLVVVGFDGSPSASVALDAALETARQRGADLDVVTTWTPVAQTVTMSYWVIAYPDRSPDEVAIADAERLQAAARDRLEASAAGVTVGWYLEQGRAQEVLVERSRHADLTVVGARGRGGLASLMLGSVSRSVVQRALSPVLVTRATAVVPGEAAPAVD